MKHKAQKIQPFIGRLNNQVSHPPRQLHRIAAELRFSVEIGPRLHRVSSPEHHWQDLLQSAEARKLAIRQDSHFHGVLGQMMVLGLLELDEG